jgi:hypothetical protein
VSDLRIHKSGVYVGMKPQRRAVVKGEKMNVDLVTLNPQAEAVASQPVQVQIFKRDYMTVKKRTKDGNWVFESEPRIPP